MWLINVMVWDISENFALGFQDAGSPVMEEIIAFHHYVMVYITYIIAGVLWMLIRILIGFNYNVRVISHKHLVHGTLLETVWTITPAIILISIAFPSFKLLYLIDEVIDPTLTIKVIGHQWYWSYEYSDYVAGKALAFDSYIIPESDLQTGDFRLLEVDNQLVVPAKSHIRVIVTAADVIHCWSIPSLGVKLDAIPGRLNQTSFLASRNGLFYGHCNEICGVNHAFMPIVIKAVDISDYCDHINNLSKNN